MKKRNYSKPFVHQNKTVREITVLDKNFVFTSSRESIAQAGVPVVSDVNYLCFEKDNEITLRVDRAKCEIR